MYGLIWRILPGPWVVKLTLSAGLIAGAAALLWYVAFPEIAPHMPFRDSAVDVEEAQDGSGGAGAPQDDTSEEEPADDPGGQGSGGTGHTGNEAPPDEEGIVGVDVPVDGDDGS